jgi:hypothetical protein
LLFSLAVSAAGVTQAAQASVELIIQRSIPLGMCTLRELTSEAFNGLVLRGEFMASRLLHREEEEHDLNCASSPYAAPSIQESRIPPDPAKVGVSDRAASNVRPAPSIVSTPGFRSHCFIHLQPRALPGTDSTRYVSHIHRVSAPSAVHHSSSKKGSPILLSTDARLQPTGVMFVSTLKTASEGLQTRIT